MFKTVVAIITLLSNVNVNGSCLRNIIISRIYIQSTIHHIAEEARLEIPFILMTKIQDYPINQIFETNLLENLHNSYCNEIAIISCTLFVLIGKYQLCIPRPLTKTGGLRRLPPSIYFDKIYNQTKTILFLMMIIFFKNVLPAF